MKFLTIGCDAGRSYKNVFRLLALVVFVLALASCDARKHVVLWVDTDAEPIGGQLKWVWWAERAEPGMDSDVVVTDLSAGELTDGFFVSGKVGRGNYVFRSTNDSVDAENEMRCSDGACVFLMYFSSAGELQWRKTIAANARQIPLGSTSDESVIFVSCQLAAGEDGSTQSVCRTEEMDANETRTKKNETIGKGEYQITAIDVLSDSSFVVTGFFSGEVTLGEAETNKYDEAVKSGFVAYYEASGEFVWAKVFGQKGEAAGIDVAASKTGGVVVVGTYQKEAIWKGADDGAVELDNNGGTDVFVAKYDLAGNFIWANNVGGTKDDAAVSVALLDDNSVLTGSQISDFALAQVHNQYVNTFTCPETNESHGACHLLVKYSTNGDYLWAQLGGGGKTKVKDVAASRWTGTSVVSGTFVHSARFDPYDGHEIVAKYEMNDMIYLAGYSDKIEFAWSRTITSLEQCIGGPVATSQTGGFLAAGAVVGEAFVSDFDADEPLFGSADHTSFFIARFD